MKKKQWKLSRTFATAWYQFNRRVWCNGIITQEYYSTRATEILNFEAFAVSWIFNYWKFHWLKWNLSTLVKSNCNNSERGVWIRDGNWFLVLHKRMQSMLLLLVKSNGFTAHLLSSTYLIHEIYEQIKKKKRMYAEVKKTEMLPVRSWEVFLSYVKVQDIGRIALRFIVRIDKEFIL